MQKARAFFFVCAGILCLAAAYHLGARSAVAQGGAVIEGASTQMGPYMTYPRATACVNRLWTWMDEYGSLHQLPIPVPGTQRIIATDPWNTVILENGDWLKYGANSWVLIGNLAAGAGPTLATQPTWGQIKSKYLPGAAATPQDK